MPDEATLVHELSHMWFGDSVTLTTWPDIWLHEGFATWSEWIWSEYQGNKSAAQWFNQLYNTPAQDTAFWTPPPGDPGTPAFMFNGTIYYRGAMTLEALREKIGDATFFTVLRDWATLNRYGNVTTAQFIDLAEQRSGMDLGALLRRLAVPTRQAHLLVDESHAETAAHTRRPSVPGATTNVPSEPGRSAGARVVTNALEEHPSRAIRHEWRHLTSTPLFTRPPSRGAAPKRP